MRILLAQTKPSYDVEKNIEKLKKIVKNKKADLYIFPELYLTGYLIRDKIMEKAIPRDDKIFQNIEKVTDDKTVIFGFPEYDNGILYNSAAVIFDGSTHIARKIYLPNFGPFEELLYFKPGNDISVFKTPYGNIGVQICYDIFFPEIAKIQALKGAELIINISASPITSRAMFETLIPARAIENTVFFAYVNWAGMMRTMEFWGGSRVVSPRGRTVEKLPYFEEHTKIIEIDMREIKIARNLRPTLRDTKKEFFNL